MFNIGQTSLPSVMTHSFSNVPNADIPRSSFDRSFDHKTTFNADYLIPIYLDEVLPADTHNVRMDAIIRLITPLTPFMDNLYIDTFFFYVPNRLLWDNWQKFCGEQTNPDDSTDYVLPTMNSGAGYANQSLSDYFGLPTQVANIEHNSLFHRAYNLIYNEWFRDQNLQDSITFNTSDSSDSPSNYILRKRGKRHDYFTSCLPWPQKGSEVSIGLTGDAPVMGIFTNGLPNSSLKSGVDATGTTLTNVYGVNMANMNVLNTTGTSAAFSESNPPQIYADLNNVTGVSINDLRESFQMQRMLERDARGGTRYTEILRSHFGVTSPDSRLQRPEYLGGGSVPFYINPLVQTSETNTSELGTLSATATAVVNTNGFVKSFVEHGVILGMACVRADLTYQQGMPRMFSRSTRYDYYWPALAHLGEQEVLNKEIYTQGSSADNEVFGYQERWAEYRYKPSQISGKMRSNDAQSLDIWHLSEDFGSLPTLSDSFIQQNTPIDRVVAVTDEPQFKGDFYFKNKTARPMPTYSVPGLIDHF